MILLNPESPATMSITVTEKDLPASLTAEQAVEQAYSSELADVEPRPEGMGLLMFVAEPQQK